VPVGDEISCVDCIIESVLVAGGPTVRCVTLVERISCVVVRDDVPGVDVDDEEIVSRVPPAEILISWSPNLETLPSASSMGVPPLVRLRHQSSGAAAPEASTPVVGQNESLK
jgi:hypothetical protein